MGDNRGVLDPRCKSVELFENYIDKEYSYDFEMRANKGLQPYTQGRGFHYMEELRRAFQTLRVWGFNLEACNLWHADQISCT